ncbi:MAG TPA: hypothetical protein VJZ51_07045 [Bacilli bacterium]|nr:hypothetical protein [Bacilli bacterium]
MKINKFKQAMEDEIFDIPNVLEKIKPAAYSRKIPIIESVQPTFKWKSVVASFAAIMIIAVGFLAFPNGLKDVELADPDNTVVPNEAAADTPKSFSRETYYEELYEEGAGLTAEATYNNYLTDEQKDAYLEPKIYFALYDIVVNKNTKDYNTAYNQLVLWGASNEYSEQYLASREGEINYIFISLTK